MSLEQLPHQDSTAISINNSDEEEQKHHKLQLKPTPNNTSEPVSPIPAPTISNNLLPVSSEQLLHQDSTAISINNSDEEEQNPIETETEEESSESDTDGLFDNLDEEQPVEQQPVEPKPIILTPSIKVNAETAVPVSLSLASTNTAVLSIEKR